MEPKVIGITHTGTLTVVDRSRFPGLITLEWRVPWDNVRRLDLTDYEADILMQSLATALLHMRSPLATNEPTLSDEEAHKIAQDRLASLDRSRTAVERGM